jgi:cytochrome c5
MSLLIKYSFLLILPLLISACGKSNSELNRVAEVSCAIIKSTNLLQSSIRVTEVNEARKKLNLPPYLEGDKIILSSVKYNLCTSLILNEKTYVEKISLATQQEQDEIAAQRAIIRAKIKEVRTGEYIYKVACAACHVSGILGAPKTQNADDWGPLIAEKGKKRLWRNAIKGINAMPPMGACGHCSEDDIMEAIDYMIEGIL